MVMSSRSKLRIRGGPFDGCAISLIGRITTMGRDSTNDIVVEQPVVSRKHARIYYDEQGYWIQDMGSQNGTYVNRRRVEEQPMPLRNGARIQLGSSATGTVWEFSEGQGAEPELESPPTLQIPIGPAASTEAPAESGQRGVPGMSLGEEGKSPCAAFTKEMDESWTCMYFVAFDAAGRQIEVSRGTSFVAGSGFLGFDMAEWLDENCE